VLFGVVVLVVWCVYVFVCVRCGIVVVVLGVLWMLLFVAAMAFMGSRVRANGD
jgi:hypothetical protein